MSITDEFQKLVEAEDYDKALAFLIQNQKEFDQGIFYYNKGTLDAKRGDLINARISFEKAKAQGFINKDLVKNLEMTKDTLGVGYLEKTYSIESDLITTVVDMSLYTPIIISSMLLISFFVFFREIKNIFLISIFFVISSLPLLGCYYVQENFEKVIVKEEAIVRVGPSKIFDESQIIPAGMMVILKKNKSKNWANIYLPKSHGGWVQNIETENL